MGDGKNRSHGTSSGGYTDHGNGGGGYDDNYERNKPKNLRKHSLWYHLADNFEKRIIERKLC